MLDRTKPGRNATSMPELLGDSGLEHEKSSLSHITTFRSLPPGQTSYTQTELKSGVFNVGQFDVENVVLYKSLLEAANNTSCQILMRHFFFHRLDFHLQIIA